MIRLLTLAVLACLMVPAVAAAEGPPAPPKAVVAQGALEGAASNGVDSFKGIPFAAPPVGEGRWRAPAPAKPWQGARNARQFGARCLQVGGGGAGSASAIPQSEDCLNLNVWRPAGATKAPVMVWIHGGANRFGSGSEPYYDGEAFARRGVVLVTINYRLGYLGFFGHPALAATGDDKVNYGLLDQIAALKWVHDNIAAFGGDPDKVTIFGESAGGVGVFNLLTAPSARGLFSQAIIESGGGLKTRQSVKSADQAGEKVATRLGFAAVEVTAQKLRAVPAAAFTSPELNTDMAPGFGPVVGGAELPEAPLDAIRAGRAAQVPLIIGVNSREGSLVDSFRMQDDAVLKLMGGDTPFIAGAYGDLTKDRPAYARRLYGDMAFVYPARETARGHAGKAPVWLYYFDYLPDAVRGERGGVNHAGEIPFVFDFSSPAMGRRSDKDNAFAAGVNGCWAAFAKTASPQGEPLCAGWKPYDPSADNWFVFADQPTEKPGLFKAQMDAIATALRFVGLN